MAAVSANFCDAHPYLYVDYTQISGVQITFIALYVVVILLSTLGNAMIIWTVFRNKHMRTVTNYYIVNLATSDFCVAMLVMPLKLLEYVAPCHWLVFSKDGLCAFLYFTLPVFVFTSVLTLVAISIERFYAVVYPLNSRTIHSKSRTRKIIAATWVLAVIFAIPFLFCKSYAFNIHSGHGTVSRQICTDRFDYIDESMYGEAMKHSGRFRKGFFLFLFVAMYVIPCCVILFTCIRMTICLLKPINKNHILGQKRNEENKRKVARMIIIVATVFIVSWSPFYMVSLISQVQQASFLRRSNFLFTMLSTHLVGFVNSGINPFLYICLSDKFRSSFKDIMQSCLTLLCFIVYCGKRKTAIEVRCRTSPTQGLVHIPYTRARGGIQENPNKQQNVKMMRHTWRTYAVRRPNLCGVGMSSRRNPSSSDSASPVLSESTQRPTMETCFIESQRLVTAALEASSPGPLVTRDCFMNAAINRQDSLSEIHSASVTGNPDWEDWEDQQGILPENCSYMEGNDLNKSQTEKKDTYTPQLTSASEKNTLLFKTGLCRSSIRDAPFCRPNSSPDRLYLHFRESEPIGNARKQCSWEQSYSDHPVNLRNHSSTDSLELIVRTSTSETVPERQQCEKNGNAFQGSRCPLILASYPCLPSDMV